MKKFSKSDEPMTFRKSHEYGSTIIHAMVTGKPAVVYGNMPNKGAISNLADDAIAEVPTLVDRSGLQFTTVGALPPQLGRLYAAACDPARVVYPRGAGGTARSRLSGVYVRPADGSDADARPDRGDVRRVDRRARRSAARLDAKKTLVPTSGVKEFHPPTPQELRASWDAAQTVGHEDDVAEWHVLGPFPIGSDKIDFVPSGARGGNGGTGRAGPGQHGFVGTTAKACGRRSWRTRRAMSISTARSARRTTRSPMPTQRCIPCIAAKPSCAAAATTASRSG